MPSYNFFSAFIFVVIFTVHCFGPSHQLSLEGRSRNVMLWHEQGSRGETTRLRRSSDDEDGVVRIYGGVPAEASYILSLQTKRGHHNCGATIIAPNLALTAAHCFDDYPASNMRVVAGERDLGVEHGSEQVRGIKRVHIHKNYTSELYNDIALIELDEPLNLTRKVVEKIEWITWPNENFAGEEGTVYGWGATEKGRNYILQKVELPILANSACRRQYASTKYTITNLMLCAGQVGSGKDTCRGDSGGPLVVDSVLVGIVSWGLGCAGDHAGVYTRVNAYIPWIQSKIQEIRTRTSVASD